MSLIEEDTTCSSSRSSDRSISPSTSEPKISAYLSGCFSYILVGDNVDKTIRPHNMTIDRQVQSIHYFQLFCAQDRIDFRDLANNGPIGKVLGLGVSVFLPNLEDCATLRENYAILIAREVVDKLSYFNIFADCVPKHIIHKYSEAMSRKSELVSPYYHNICHFLYA